MEATAGEAKKMGGFGGGQWLPWLREREPPVSFSVYESTVTARQGRLATPFTSPLNLSCSITYDAEADAADTAVDWAIVTY